MKVNKSVLKKWWVWVIAVVILFGIGNLLRDNSMPRDNSIEVIAPVTSELNKPMRELPQSLTEIPTEKPTEAPTAAPAVAPTETPTVAPTETPAVAPAVTPTETPAEVPTEEPTETPENLTEDSDLKLISLTNPVNRNEKATLQFQGEPNTVYSITVVYSSKASESAGLEPAESDKNGNVSWTWKIGSRTKPGTYPITIKGNGQTFETKITVN